MNARVVSLFVGLAFVAAPVCAQIRPASNSGPGGGGAIQQVAADLAALTARIAKLEGNIVAADLAGTYAVTVIQTDMSGVRPPATEATITTSVIRASFTLNADGTGNAAPVTDSVCEGTKLALPSGAIHAIDCTESGSAVTWTYVDGVATITFPDGDQLRFNVALGGRFFITAFAPFHPGEPSSNQVLFIAARLK